MRNKIADCCCLVALCYLWASLAGCGIVTKEDALANSVAAQASENERQVTCAQAPWLLTLEYLPSGDTPKAGTASRQNGSSNVVLAAVFKLRLQSLNAKVPVQELLQLVSPDVPVAQRQMQLLYQMDNAAYLQIGQERIRPVAAQAVITPRQDEFIDVVFTLPVHPAQLRQVKQVEFVLSNAFFLSDTARFVYPARSILAPSL